MARIVPPKLLALPWIPPSLPWWELGGRWKKDTGPVPGKMLVFSRFRAAPPALASLMSFAMETEVARGSRNYERLGKARPLAASATRLPLLALFLPSPTIIRNTDPLRSRDRSLPAIKRDMRNRLQRS